MNWHPIKINQLGLYEVINIVGISIFSIDFA